MVWVSKCIIDNEENVKLLSQLISPVSGIQGISTFITVERDISRCLIIGQDSVGIYTTELKCK